MFETEITENNFPEVGKKCPLCKKGLIVFSYAKEDMSVADEHAEVGCSNKKCNGYIGSVF